MIRGVWGGGGGGPPVVVGPPKVQRFIFTSVQFSTNHMSPCSQWAHWNTHITAVKCTCMKKQLRKTNKKMVEAAGIEPAS